MHIRFERRHTDYEVGCDCGVRFAVAYGSNQAECPECADIQTMAKLFEEWWRAEHTFGRFAYHEG